MSLFIANKIKQLISEYVHLLVIILLMVCITACTPTDQHKSSRTRSFKLTEDSTFIGAWGGVLFLEDSRGEHGWNNNFIMESETQMSEYYTSLKHCYRYKIDDSDNLIFSKEVFENNGKDTFHVEYYKFKPYYFKTIKNL
ncbi:MAG: hypothetical protein IPO02_11905 [Bacteroidetes bacterium]|nr:hypothetical protein [Bacteroidota bacterium]